MRRKQKTLDFDLVVVGGGMTGICAAIAAARNGAKVALVHGRSVLGGNASSEIRIHINSATDGCTKPDLEEGGILNEIMLENKRRNPYFSYSIWDNVLFEKVYFQENLTLFLDTNMYDVLCEDDTIKEIYAYQDTTETNYVFRAPYFADCTGNGTLGYFAGADFMIGSETKDMYSEPHAPEKADNFRMGNTILFRAVDRGEPVKFEPPAFAKKLTEDDLKFRVHCKKIPDFSMAEDPEEYARTSTRSSAGVDYGFWWIELCGKDDIIEEFEDIRTELYAWLYGVWDHIKNGGDHGAENFDLEWVGALPGMRESRRLVGDYIFNECDIWAARSFEDAVCHGGWSVDFHTPGGVLDKDLLPSATWVVPGTYTIPYRSFYSKNINNLFMAGRNLSATRLGLASTRIIGTCAVCGQAMGTAAALCVKNEVSPRGLLKHIDQLQQTLLKDDCFIPWVKNHDEKDMALSAEVFASKEQAGFPAQDVINGVSRHFEGAWNGWKCDAGDKLTLAWKEAKTLSQIRLTFDSDFATPIRITMAPLRQAQQKKGLPKVLVKSYRLNFIKNGETVFVKDVDSVTSRLSVADFEPVTCDKVEIEILSTYGETGTIFEVRAY
ncbi:MAG: FAD-dependent oxidoreductase [Clostridia bacterium]|nr:FAD-dependent oxidoreductase [Clostridia bacterium]